MSSVVRVALIGLVLALGAGRWALAQGVADVFEMRGVKIDATAANASAAREKAMAEGEARAFRLLLERLTLRPDHPRLPKVAANEVGRYIKDFDVAGEKTSTVRYLATLNIRFKSDDIRRLLSAANLAVAETPSKPLLVVPLYYAQGGYVLWEDPNPWRQAWNKLPASQGLVPLAVPLGDIGDVASLSVEQAVSGDAVKLAEAATRYGAGDALVAIAVAGEAIRAGEAPAVQVFLTRRGSVNQDKPSVSLYTPKPKQSLDDLLLDAARDVAGMIEDQWKSETMVQHGSSGVLAVVVPVKGLADWLAVRKKLSAVPLIRETEMVLISKDEVRINLNFLGEVEQLRLAVAQVDLALSEERDVWTLRMAGGGRR